MSPRARRATYVTNCTGSGRSEPGCRRSASTCAGVAVSPATSATGSAGMTREITKVMARRPSSVGTNHARRRSVRARSLMPLLRQPPPAPGARGEGEGALPRLLRVVDPAHLLAVADRAEADPFEALRPRAEVLRVVD